MRSEGGTSCSSKRLFSHLGTFSIFIEYEKPVEVFVHSTNAFSSAVGP